MHTSTILASFFALSFTSLVSQGATTCLNVKQSDNDTTSIRLRGSGQTCGQFPLIVPKTDFQFKVYIPHKSTDTSFGSLQIYFGDLAVPLYFDNDGAALAVYTKGGTYIGDATHNVTTFDIKPDGTGFVVPRKPTAFSIKIPSLEKFQRYHEDKVMIQLKIEWTNVNEEIVIELPNLANNNGSAPPKSTTSTFTSTNVVSYAEINETTAISAILTSSNRESSNATSKVSWIVIDDSKLRDYLPCHVVYIYFEYFITLSLLLVCVNRWKEFRAASRIVRVSIAVGTILFSVAFKLLGIMYAPTITAPVAVLVSVLAGFAFSTTLFLSLRNLMALRQMIRVVQMMLISGVFTVGNYLTRDGLSTTDQLVLISWVAFITLAMISLFGLLHDQKKDTLPFHIPEEHRNDTNLDQLKLFVKQFVAVTVEDVKSLWNGAREAVTK
uniref:CUB_2 domain-containing protein n=1 Tax=Panagrellus redivivus TaxID=6233 RepID=A0A7E4VM07_PANRE